MHFVSQQVFISGTRPELKVIKWLSESVTFKDQTKRFALFSTEDVVDPTPVLRSFLTKLFLQCHESTVVSNYLNSTIETWGKTPNPQDELPKMVMMIECHKVSAAHAGYY